MKKTISLFLMAFLLVGTLSFVLAEAQMGQDSVELNLIASSDKGQVAVVSSNSGDEQNLRVQTGDYVGANGEQMMIRQEAGEQLRLQVGGMSAHSDLQLQQKNVDGKMQLSVQLSNGRNAEVKVMPDAASEVARERLRLKNCSGDNACSIELKEVGAGDGVGLAYEIKTEKQSKVLGLFGAKMRVQAQVDAETGELMSVSKPWWAVLATEPEE